MSQITAREVAIDHSDHFREELIAKGWSLLPASVVGQDPRAVLKQIGQLIPQYNGLDTFEVTYKPGFDDAPYSQSMNGLGAHTEAPGYSPPPKYLALHCHRQARCGKGHTLLADAVRFYEEALAPDLRDWASENEIEFVAASRPGSSERMTLRAPIRGSYQDEPMMRFSYNQFRYGNVNATAEDKQRAEVEPSDPLGRIAEAGEAFFAQNLVPVLIPDGSLLVWNNHRLFHGRGEYSDPARHLTRYWIL